MAIITAESGIDIWKVDWGTKSRLIFQADCFDYYFFGCVIFFSSLINKYF